MLQAVVMAGGQGQRLQPLTLGRPKPLVPLFGRPLLGYLLRHLRERGVGEVFVTAGHLGDQIARYVRGLAPDIPVRCRVEASARGTAGAVADLLPELRSPFLVVSGDAVLDLDVQALLAAHRRDGNVATICLAPPSERLRFGTVALEGARVRGFVEKPPLAQVLRGTSINTGCYLLDVRALEAVVRGGGEAAGRGPARGAVAWTGVGEREAAADGQARWHDQARGAGGGAAGEGEEHEGEDGARPMDFALDVFPALLACGARVGAVAAARYWRDIGTLEAYRETHFEGLGGCLPWVLPDSGCERAEIARDAHLEGSVHVAPGVRIGTGAQVVGPAVLGLGCRVGRGAQVTRSVLLDGCRIGPLAVVRDCVVDARARVPAGAHLVGAGVGGNAIQLRLRRGMGSAGAGAQAGAMATGVTAQGDGALPEGAEAVVAAAPLQ